MRTDETRMVEDELRKGGFPRADAYRYNIASIRVRVIDPRFEGLSDEARDGMVEPLLDQLPEETQVDIISLYTFAPSEVEPGAPLTREFMLNAEFEDPSPSLL
jgi:hypothetical protein